jgi:hypothetical protein
MELWPWPIVTDWKVESLNVALTPMLAGTEMLVGSFPQS